MKKLMLKNLQHVITCNDNDEILQNVNILIEGNKIKAISKDIVPDRETEIRNCSNLTAIPGFVNTHHHFYQILFRGIPEVQDKPLYSWLSDSYKFWQHLNEEAVYYSSLLAFTELLRTGCTTTADHHYLFPKDISSKLIDIQFDAATQMGIRFHATRGSMSAGKSKGGLPPDILVQSEKEIIEDSIRVIDKFNDNSEFSMRRVALAPSSQISVTLDLMKESRDLARSKGVMLHTHLGETLDEQKYCLEKYGKRPLEIMEEIGWLGEDVWFAHGIWFNDEEIKKLRNTGISHCPTCNMKLGSGICRTSELLESGVKLSIAVDGSASNDGSNMWEEVRRAYLLNKLKYGSNGMTAYDILKTATRGGAEVLGRKDIGSLETGKAADIVLIDLNEVSYAGSHDPIVSIVNLGNSSMVDTTIVNGKVVVRKGKLVKHDEDKINFMARKISKEMVKKGREDT
ncbi:8-oxoguanine deaminase [Gottschalkia purinilytica]|uniref:8-oxoguanine deaminase n=1 Tax=Gottschalkia purinilytica TaxID=1503 RepID=A0A0L0W7L1_GOTPU|nr:8-oxoguanine deaminase [Gottschalkia purinilytica]KNF07451.1 8-oxoguanine deaminase [Gottschalkia purinilytica]